MQQTIERAVHIENSGKIITMVTVVFTDDAGVEQARGLPHLEGYEPVKPVADDAGNVTIQPADISDLPDHVQGIASAVWTPDVVSAAKKVREDADAAHEAAMQAEMENKA